MPYDNKQCKSYKALKIKYAGYKINKDSGDNEFTVFGWDNDNQQSNLSALIDLDDVKKYINPNGYATVLDTLLAQNVEYYLDDDQPIKALSSAISKLTYGELLYQLSPTAWSVRDLENAGKVDDDEKL